MINLTDFTEKETKGLVALVRVTTDALAVSTKKFNPETGEELSEEVIGGNIKEYTDKKAELLKQIAEIDSFVKKFNALVPQQITK